MWPVPKVDKRGLCEAPVAALFVIVVVVVRFGVCGDVTCREDAFEVDRRLRFSLGDLVFLVRQNRLEVESEMS